MEEKAAKKRIWELDFLRGVAIFVMIFVHLGPDFRRDIEFRIYFYRPGGHGLCILA